MKAAIEKTTAILNAGGVVLYPTDTVWGLGCDATNPKAVERIYQIKKRHESKALICLVSDLEMLKRHVDVPVAALRYIEQAERPTTIIYHHPRGVAPNLVAGDDTLAIRIASDEFCRELVSRFGGPIVSTSANTSGAPTPQTFKEIPHSIRQAVDYVVDWGREQTNGRPSTIIKLDEGGRPHILRP